MSADNGIYILKCKDICKIKEIRGVDRLFDEKDRLLPIRTFWEFKNAPDAPDMNGATEIAVNTLNEIDYCEKGIVILPTDKTWGYFKRKAYTRNRR